jgi:amidophosphoribosyltransferase
MCGIFAAFNAHKAAELTVIGLHGNQHRAIDFSGIVSTDGYNLYRERGAGLARQVFDIEMLNRLHGLHALGHIRYPTVSDKPHREDIQPVMGNYRGTPFAVAHNGNLINKDELGTRLHNQPMATSMDTEYIPRLLESIGTGNFMEDLVEVLTTLRGSYALGILLPESLLAIRDPRGNRPLSIGASNGSYFISSETSGFGGVGASFVRDVKPGEIVSISSRGLESHQFAAPEEKRCRFEGNYFSLPTSTVFGEPVYGYRRKLGAALEENCPTIGADIVTPVPDSSDAIAEGYAESTRSGLYRKVILRNHYVGRTFIAATQAKRDAEVAQKFYFNPPEIEGKKIVVVDDSIVRGTTLPKIIGELRRYGAREVHVRIGTPPIKYPCTYGINTPSREELISASLTADEICEKVGADSLAFLPIDVQKNLSPEAHKYCFACMDGEYWQ